MSQLLLAVGDDAGAAEAYQTGFELTEGLMTPEQLVGGYTNLAHMWADAGHGDRAEEFLLKTLEAHAAVSDGAPTVGYASALESMADFYELAVRTHGATRAFCLHA